MDYSRSCSGDNQVVTGCTRNGSCSNAAATESSRGVDVKLYVALESSSSATSVSQQQQQQQMPRSHYNNPGYSEGNGSSRPRMVGSDMNSGRCPHHVKLGDSEWTNANQIRVPYQVSIIIRCSCGDGLSNIPGILEQY